MLLTFDRWFRTIRATRSDDRGASLILVIGLMAVGFIVASTIAAASMFAISQTTQSRKDLQAFAAAEGGRDAMVAALTDPHFVCSVGRTYTPADFGLDPDPDFRAKIYTSKLSTVAAADLTPAELKEPTWSTACPTVDTTYVRLIVNGDLPDGGTEQIDSVYTWAAYKSVVEGGALGFMDSEYTTWGVRYSGDIVVRNGNFTCADGTTIDGSVYVLNGQFRVETPVDLIIFTIYTGSNCTINGDIVASGSVEVPSRTGSSKLTVAGSIATGANVNAAQPVDVKGDVEAKGSVSVGSSGRLRVGVLTSGETQVLKPYRQTREDGDPYTYAKSDILAEGAISASGELSTDRGAIATNSTLTASSATVSARTGLGARGGITASGSAQVRATAGSVASGATISTASGATVSGGGVVANGAITGSGTVSASVGDVRAGGGIAAGTVTAGGSIQAMGDLVVNAATAGTTILATGKIDGGSGVVSAAGAVRAGTTVTSAGGTVRSTGDTLTAVGSIETDGSNGTGTISAAANVHSGGDIKTGRGTITSTSGSILAKGSISSTDTGTISTAKTSAKEIRAGGDITLKGPIVGFGVKAVGKFDSSSTCDLADSIVAGGTTRFSLAKVADSTSAARCIIRGDVRSFAATATADASKSALPTNTTDTQSPRTQIWVKGSVQARSWISNSRYRKMTGDTPSGNPINSAPSGTPTGTAPGTSDIPAVPAAPTGLTTPNKPEAYAFVAPDYPNLHVRTGWIDLGKKTNWGSAFGDRVELTTAQCNSNAMNPIRTELQKDATTGVVIDATACNKIQLTGWSSLNLHRDAVILANRVGIELIRFSQTGGVPRQLFIIQIDDNLRTARPPYDASAPPEPQPDCEGRGAIETFGSGWAQEWDANVRVMLYSPCGTTWLGSDTSLFRNWNGRQYVANNGAQKDIIARITCQAMSIPDVLDLPCHVDTVGAVGGAQIITGKRMGVRIYQTEP